MDLAQDSVEVPPDSPFSNDKLARKETAEKLTRLIGGTDGPLVLSINGRWGTGKTTFIRMWSQMLQNREVAKSLTFNAWDNDYVGDPIVAFIDEIRALLSEDERFDQVVDETFDRLETLISALAPVIIRGMTGGLVAEGASNLVEAFREERNKIDEFREELTDIAETVLEETGSPLVIFVDELDRCRPDFAVKLLERIKHLFDVPGIIFILAVDFKQLRSSIRSLYGSDMEADGYLRRFIDLRYRLPRPEDGNFIQYLYSQYDTSNLIAHGDVERDLLEMAKACARHFGLSLRGKQRLMLRIDLALRQLGSSLGLTMKPFVPAVPFLVCMRVAKPEAYNNILMQGSADQGQVLSEADRIESGLVESVSRRSSVSREHYLEGVVRAVFAGDAFDGHLSEVCDRFSEVSGMSASEYDGSLEEKHQKERELEHILATMSAIDDNGGWVKMKEVIDAVELAGDIERV